MSNEELNSIDDGYVRSDLEFQSRKKIVTVYSPLSPPSPPALIKKQNNKIYSSTIVPISLIISKFKEANQTTLTQMLGQKIASSSDESSDKEFIKKKPHPTPPPS